MGHEWALLRLGMTDLGCVSRTSVATMVVEATVLVAMAEDTKKDVCGRSVMTTMVVAMMDDPTIGVVVLHHVDRHNLHDRGNSPNILLTVMGRCRSEVLEGAIILSGVVNAMCRHAAVATMTVAVSQEWSTRSKTEVCRGARAKLSGLSTLVPKLIFAMILHCSHHFLRDSLVVWISLTVLLNTHLCAGLCSCVCLTRKPETLRIDCWMTWCTARLLG